MVVQSYEEELIVFKKARVLEAVMGLLGDIRKFLQPIVRNPIKTGIVAYLVFKLLQKSKVQEVAMLENIKVIQSEGEFELIFDDVTKAYGVVDGREVHTSAKPFRTLRDAQRHMKKLVGKEQITQKKYRSTLDELHEGFMK